MALRSTHHIVFGVHRCAAFCHCLAQDGGARLPTTSGVHCAKFISRLVQKSIKATLTAGINTVMHMREIINRAAGQTVLYHGTSFDGLLIIFAENVLRGFPTDVRIGDKIMHDGQPSVSFTRSHSVALSHAGKDTNRGRGGRAVLVFDRARLARHFGRKLQPIDVLQIRGHSPDNPFTGVSEFEERIPGDIRDVRAFVVAVIVPDRAAFARFEQVTVAHDPTLQATFALIRAKVHDPAR